MIYGSINLLAVLVAAIFSMILGGLWYSPLLFGNMWMKLAKIKPNTDQMAKSYIAGFLASLITMYVLANVLNYAGVGSVTSGISVGFLVWIGFFVTTALGTILWEGKSPKLFAINIGYSFVNIIVASIIIAVW